jgi:hypothetical protein
MSSPPITILSSMGSFNIRKDSPMAMATLSLSIGATFETLRVSSD